MGEIKSTLDLVLEKTRHLTLSDEEKQKQQQSHALKILKGVLQKYRDGQIQLGRLQEELEKLTAGPGALDAASITVQVLKRIQLDADNAAWLAYLETVASDALTGIQQVLSDYAETVQKEARERRKQIRQELEKQYAISGPAVIPNLQADGRWQQRRAALREKYDGGLQEAKDAFVGSLTA